MTTSTERAKELLTLIERHINDKEFLVHILDIELQIAFEKGKGVHFTERSPLNASLQY